MPKPRDYKREYARRMARAAERGLTKAQARGHARMRPPDDPERIGALAGKLEFVLRHMRRDGLSLAAAARKERVSPERARRAIVDQGLAVRDGKGWRFPDVRLRDIELYTAGERKVIARPEGMAREVFTARVAEIVAWFEGLNPYGFGGSILKVEDVNFSLDDPTRREPLFVFAVSAKRYALFNIGPDGAALLRKASGHGLGHLLAPYRERGPAHLVPAPVAGLAKLGVDLWQHDVWWLIVDAALRGDPLAPGYHRLPGFDAPAAHRFSVTTPEVAKWVNRRRSLASSRKRARNSVSGGRRDW